MREQSPRTLYAAAPSRRLQFNDGKRERSLAHSTDAVARAVAARRRFAGCGAGLRARERQGRLRLVLPPCGAARCGTEDARSRGLVPPPCLGVALRLARTALGRLDAAVVVRLAAVVVRLRRACRPRGR